MNKKQSIIALGALAHEIRLDLFRLLVRRGREGLSAGAVAERLGIVPSSLSFHLQQLVLARLITQTRVGRQIIYAVKCDAMSGLMAYLTENCCAESSGRCEVTATPATASATASGRRRRAA